MKHTLLTFLTLALGVLACALPGPNATNQTPNAVTQQIKPSPNALVISPRPTPTAPTSQPTATVTASDYLRVRDVPMGLRIGYLNHGDSVTLTNKCSDEPYPKGWAQIEWGGGVAWVSARYISENKCSEEE